MVLGLLELVVYLMGLLRTAEGTLVKPGLLGVEGSNEVFVWFGISDGESNVQAARECCPLV